MEAATPSVPVVRVLLITLVAVFLLGAIGAFVIFGPLERGSSAVLTREETREIAIRAYAWGFTPRVIRLNPNEKVRLVVGSDDLKHGFAVPEMGLNLPLEPGVVRTRTLTLPLVDRRYTIRCSVFCGAGHSVMKARLIVGNPPAAPGSRWVWIASILTAVAALGVGTVSWQRTVDLRSDSGQATASTTDLMQLAPVRWAVRWHPFQFTVVLPALVLVVVALASAASGIDHPGLNFGVIVTWMVWWGLLLVSLAVVGRVWCLACPIGAVGEWIQRFSLWWRSSGGAGFDLPWPRRLRGLWLATVLFAAFVWLDSGYGIANSPRMTAGLIVVLLLAAAWIHLVFERRAFCRYLCPLTPLLGLGAMTAAVELRRRDAATCRVCRTKDCYRGNTRAYGCPVGEFPGGGMDTNLRCIWCTECMTACPYENLTIRLRPVGQDLWALRKVRLDEAIAAIVLVGWAVLVPLLVSALLPGLRTMLAQLLPPGTPPGDPPRLVGVAVLFAGGVAVALGLVYACAQLARWGAGGSGSTHTLFMRLAYMLVPLALFRMIADFVDSAVLAGGTVRAAVRGLLLDFPFNRVVPGTVTPGLILSPGQTYLVEVLFLLVGLTVTLRALHRTCRLMFAERPSAMAVYIPMAGLAVLLTMLGVWTLGAGYL